jgi:hypothetical protein
LRCSVRRRRRKMKRSWLSRVRIYWIIIQLISEEEYDAKIKELNNYVTLVNHIKRQSKSLIADLRPTVATERFEASLWNTF